LEALKIPLMFFMPILPSFECRACGSDPGTWKALAWSNANSGKQRREIGIAISTILMCW